MSRNLHQQSAPQVHIDDVWKSPGHLLVDVRSPKEYEEGRIPDAINLPLLNNSERATIGTLYKLHGSQEAIDEAYELMENKKDGFLAQIRKLPKDKTIVVCCARGGMRSQVVTVFLNMLGYTALQLYGGYKQFRAWTIKFFENFQFQNLVVLQGQTGVGKTIVLNKLNNSFDLEGLAHHRGSLFGGIGRTPITQKNFEAELMERLLELDNTSIIFVEGESRKVGDLVIPNNIFAQMKKAKVIMLEASIKTRTRRLIDEYIVEYPDLLQELRVIIPKLKGDIGKDNVEMLLNFFDEGNYEECISFVLIHYYDKKYAHSMKGLTPLETISTEDINQTVQTLKSIA